MEWPKQLLEIFDDPLLDGVRPKAAAPTADDRMASKLMELNNWMEKHGRKPRNEGDLKERMMWAAMQGLRRKNLL